MYIIVNIIYVYSRTKHCISWYSGCSETEGGQMGRDLTHTHLYSCNMYTYMYTQGTRVCMCWGYQTEKGEGTHTYAAGVGKGGVYGHLVV